MNKIITIKKNQTGFTHHLLIVGLVVLLAIGGAGYYVWSKRSKTESASAATYRWTTLASTSSGSFIKACKSVSGGGYKLRAQARNGNKNTKMVWAIKASGKKILGGDVAYNITTNVHYTTVSKTMKVYPDFGFAPLVGEGASGSVGESVSVSMLQDC